ncbi:LCP family protein [Streptomyces sp. NPDC093795]|uniref:LCP family protein n=1 Tax=Streptomyces sp. NPDC093795 TaxID=3366051 RepID=UPI003801E6EF
MSVRKFTRPRRLVLAAAALVALGSGAFAAAPAALPSPALPSPSRGLNILVVGLDTRKGVTAWEKEEYRLGGKECGCTDVMMLVHVSADNRRVSVLGLPRDSLTEFPAGHRDRRTGAAHDTHAAKLNGAWAEGGPSYAMEMVERTTRLPVHRYLEVDFRRFMDAVDQFDDGVPICVKEPLKDTVTGIDLARGTTNVGGGEALQYVRSRRADGQMDFGRIRKQQQFVVNTLRKVRSDLLADPVKLMEFASVLRGPRVADRRGLSNLDLLFLALRLRNLTPDRMEFATVPVLRFETVQGAGSAVAWNVAHAEEVFARLRADEPLPPARLTPSSEVPQAEYRPAGGASLVCS